MYSFNTYFEHSLWARSSVGRGVWWGGRRGSAGADLGIGRNTAACVSFKSINRMMSLSGPKASSGFPRH